MTTAIFILASTAILYLILCPVVDWYQKAKKEMEEDERRD